MGVTISKKLGLNKVEKAIISAVVLAVTLFATVNIVWLANKFGIHITNAQTQKILDAVTNGASLGSAFALVLGVTLPAWAVAAAAALGATSA